MAPLPDGLPIEMGMMIRLAMERNYDLLMPTMEKVGFIQKGEQISVEDVDEMLAQYVEPVQVPVFHYTRKWLQRHAAANMERTRRTSGSPARWICPPGWRSRCG